MSNSVFLEFEFFLLIALSLVLPFGIYSYMMWKRSISRLKVFILGLCLIIIAGTNLVLLQYLAQMARNSASLVDDRIFVSEISMALYLFPALFAGIGVNLISHVLVAHLGDAERQHDRRHDDDLPGRPTATGSKSARTGDFSSPDAINPPHER